MSVTIKSQREIELMRHAGKLLGQTLKQLEEAVRPGMSTWELNQIGEEIIRGYGCIPSFLNYNGYPASICISLNDEVVHGIPRKDFIIQEGDIVSITFPSPSSVRGTYLSGISCRCCKNSRSRRNNRKCKKTHRSHQTELF